MQVCTLIIIQDFKGNSLDLGQVHALSGDNSFAIERGLERRVCRVLKFAL